MRNNINSDRIVELLRAKHAKDVFVDECKMGPTRGGHRRLDAWAMRRSWSPVTMVGYEVKVARSDFMADDKWTNYLAACHEFYFVCPAGLIQRDELPDGVGLMWVASTGSTVVTKRKAVRREIALPAELMVYVLMSRTHIVGDMNAANSTREQRLAYWRRWINERKSSRSLGYEVSSRIAEHVYRVELENSGLKSRMDSYDELMGRIAELGFDVSAPVSTWQVKNRLDELVGAVSPRLADDLRRVANELDGIRRNGAA